MNANTEYELFTREVYRQLSAYYQTGFTKVQHNIKLKGRSGCEHQIDVYWEYKKDRITYRVAIECKNYNKRVPKEKVCAFYGMLVDLDDVEGIMVSKKGFQKGARQYAEHYGISLKELRSPYEGETIIGRMILSLHVETSSMLFLVDEQWAEEHGINIYEYKRWMDMISFENDHQWSTATHIPLETIDGTIRDSNGDTITSLRSLKHDTTFEDAYVNTYNLGPVKILEVKFERSTEDIQRNIAIDAEGFVKAILKDAFNNTTDFMVMR